LKNKQHAGQLRIIGGQWRSRTLAFPDVEGLRPTPDRVRETLFNWLQAVMPGARCLDLFAGSGALGLEALSRGALQAVFVEQDAEAARCVRESLRVLHASAAQVIQVDVLAYLQGTAQVCDVVFVDPPYRHYDLLQTCCARLEAGGWLAPRAYIYLETESNRDVPPLPLNWQVIRSKKAGQVGYHLILRDALAATDVS
jgi:16S rRNA (guanine966-N2)-methyltransferase